MKFAQKMAKNSIKVGEKPTMTFFPFTRRLTLNSIYTYALHRILQPR